MLLQGATTVRSVCITSGEVVHAQLGIGEQLCYPCPCVVDLVAIVRHHSEEIVVGRHRTSSTFTQGFLFDCKHKRLVNCVPLHTQGLQHCCRQTVPARAGVLDSSTMHGFFCEHVRVGQYGAHSAVFDLKVNIVRCPLITPCSTSKVLATLGLFLLMTGQTGCGDFNRTRGSVHWDLPGLAVLEQ